jgi:hypothetical protein
MVSHVPTHMNLNLTEGTSSKLCLLLFGGGGVVVVFLVEQFLGFCNVCLPRFLISHNVDVSLGCGRDDFHQEFLGINIRNFVDVVELFSGQSEVYYISPERRSLRCVDIYIL